MAGQSILDADMTTLAGWARSGFAWWLAELRAMLPTALRAQARPFAAYVAWSGSDDWQVVGGGSAMPVLVDPAQCLVREMVLPPLGDADLDKLVQLDADRILPLPAARLVLAARADPADRSRVTVAGLPRDRAAAMLAALAAEGLAATRVGLADPARPGLMTLDFTPALAEAGLIAPPREGRKGWWALVGFLFALNLALLVVRDVQSVSRMEALVAAQAPAVNAARAITSRIDKTRASAAELAARREAQDALGILAAVTETLPAESWVQRYAWDGKTLRIAGYKRAGSDVVGALRKNPRFADVRAANAEAIAEVPTGQPFDISATVKEPVR